MNLLGIWALSYRVLGVWQKAAHFFILVLFEFSICFQNCTEESEPFPWLDPCVQPRWSEARKGFIQLLQLYLQSSFCTWSYLHKAAPLGPIAGRADYELWISLRWLPRHARPVSTDELHSVVLSLCGRIRLLGKSQPCGHRGKRSSCGSGVSSAFCFCWASSRCWGPEASPPCHPTRSARQAPQQMTFTVSQVEKKGEMNQGV